MKLLHTPPFYSPYLLVTLDARGWVIHRCDRFISGLLALQCLCLSCSPLYFALLSYACLHPPCPNHAEIGIAFLVRKRSSCIRKNRGKPGLLTSSYALLVYSPCSSPIFSSLPISRFSPASPISRTRSSRTFSAPSWADTTNTTRLVMFWNLTNFSGIDAVPCSFQSVGLIVISCVASVSSASSKPRLCGLLLYSLSSSGRAASSVGWEVI